jgi:hypothetical protein|mmetsp:Transcript_55878/g.91983  ORF Transcript_55878/g.91983 Transcript_55878/m.91983 type:complete len:94 (-) Transcript_55878:298-579(-)
MRSHGKEGDEKGICDSWARRVWAIWVRSKVVSELHRYGYKVSVKGGRHEKGAGKTAELAQAGPLHCLGTTVHILHTVNSDGSIMIRCRGLVVY